nr:MAG TPA_asm: hypothetical protein [Bacteriophage sp.]DAW96998.1 MAG TPA: hypothetical protein [Bacteriophage sp.]
MFFLPYIRNIYLQLICISFKCTRVTVTSSVTICFNNINIITIFTVGITKLQV